MDVVITKPYAIVYRLSQDTPEDGYDAKLYIFTPGV